MSDIIRLLPDHVANQIAAGEVVQRPASVVKELLENSVDAVATSVALVVKDAGRTLIQVSDNGMGMSPTDARLSFERHATSKISKADDLFALRTKGFRGEALASIAAVAQVELKTRRTNDELGTRIVIEGSRIRSQEPIAAPVGTSLSVRSLFFNVPARRQFLKSDAVELKHIVDEFQRVALAHPDLAFTLVHNDQEMFHLPAHDQPGVSSAGLRLRIAHLFGRKYDERLVPVEEHTDFVSVMGFTGKPEHAKRTRGEQFFFVNRRFIRSNYLDHAVRTAYDALLPKDHYPGCWVFLELDPAHIDINIHPTKTEIKFRDDRTVYAIVNAAVRRGLGKNNMGPSLDFDHEPAIDIMAQTSQRSVTVQSAAWRSTDLGRHTRVDGWQQLFDLSGTEDGVVRRPVDNGRNKDHAEPGIGRDPSSKTRRDDEGTESATEATEVGHAPITLPSRALDDVPNNERPVTQLHGKYILAQTRSGFIVVDQQRAHERIHYERALKSLTEGAGMSQQQLFPATVELSPADHVLLSDILPDLRALGFDLEPMSGSTVAVNGMPAEAADEDPAALLGSLLEQVKHERGTLRNERHHALARSMAFGVAQRQVRTLTTTEMHDLIDRLFACEQPYRSPGGKPVIVPFSLDELNERFER
ncbi:MAG: DNA mismatch repair endonuclease MutL [Flavobacteriales bacterium]|nr:MAG: DNA mismatch repair endonuclease MutL [Flavobacteriales bacterium]